MEEVDKRNQVPSPPPPPPPSFPHHPSSPLPPPLPPLPHQDYYTIRNKMLFDKVSDYKYSIMEHE